MKVLGLEAADHVQKEIVYNEVPREEEELKEYDMTPVQKKVQRVEANTSHLQRSREKLRATRTLSPKKRKEEVA